MGLAFYVIYFGKMLAFRIESEVLNLTLRSSLDLVLDHPPSSSHKPLSPSTPGFNFGTSSYLSYARLWGSLSCDLERRQWLRNNVRSLTQDSLHLGECEEHSISDVAGMKMGMRIARLIESHVFTEAQRIPFRNRNWAHICQWTRQNGCTLETKSTKICWAEPQLPTLIIKKLTCTGNAKAARRLIREHF